MHREVTATCAVHDIFTLALLGIQLMRLNIQENAHSNMHETAQMLQKARNNGTNESICQHTLQGSQEVSESVNSLNHN